MLRLILLLITAAFCASGQITTGAVSGYVTDASDRPVANASVKATASSNGVLREAVTDSAGLYQLRELPPGLYTLSVHAAGFADVSNSDVALAVNSRLRLDVKLSVAGVQQTVNVTAEVRPLSTESAELGNVFSPSQVYSLPLNRRDFLQLALLTPGVLPPVEDSELSTRGSFSMHANGAREEFNNFLLDGVDNNDPDVNRYNLQPAVDSIQEFKIATNLYSAEYGRSAGGQVNVITRSGSNQFHGFAYEYLRNRVLDARNYFESGDELKYIRNQFGAGAGGPIVKDRTFFFANFDALRERRGYSRLATVPAADLRSGDLSSLGRPIIDPFTQSPFPNNRIPASRINPVSQKVLSLFPAANRSGDVNFLAQPVGSDEQSQANVRVDHRLTASDMLMFRYSYLTRSLVEPFTESATNIPGFGDFVDDTGHNATIQHQHIFGPRTVNSLVLGFNRVTRRAFPENHTTDVNALWGVSWLPAKAVDFGFPTINVAGFSSVGDVTQIPIDRAGNIYQLTDGLTVVRGRHALKLGVEFRHNQHNGINDLLTRGTLTFSGQITGSGIGDLLLGFPTLGIQSQADNVQTLRTTATNLYVQDDWKILPRLTLNLGLRYEYNTPPTDPTNRMTVLDRKTGQIVQVGQNGVSRSGIQPDRNNFAPRIGFAYSASKDTVIRGGYGVYYDAGLLVASTALYFNPPYFNIRVFFPTATSLLTLNNPFPTQGGLTPPASLSTVDPGLVSAYLQHWNLSVQRSLGNKSVVTLAYAGSKGTHLIRSLDLNQPPPGQANVQLRRPNPQFGNIFYTESGGNSNFHSLQASWNGQITRGLSIVSAYTFSKSIDDTSAFLGTKADKNFPQNSLNYTLERAVSSFDVRHRFSGALVWSPGQRYLRGFQASTLIAANSGQPFTPILRFDNSNTGNSGGQFGSDRPNVLHDPNLSSGRTPQRWFDTAAFTIPAPFTFGNAGRNIVRGPGYFSTDVSVSRKFPIGDRAAFELGWQAFNVFNRTNFDLPERYADEPSTFGQILSAKPARQMQLVARFSF